MVLWVATNQDPIYKTWKRSEIKKKEIERKCFNAIVNLDSERFKVKYFLSCDAASFELLGNF